MSRFELLYGLHSAEFWGISERTLIDDVDEKTAHRNCGTSYLD